LSLIIVCTGKFIVVLFSSPTSSGL
jgi:hypothetical protein